MITNVTVHHTQQTCLFFWAARLFYAPVMKLFIWLKTWTQQGHRQEFVSEGDKRVGSITSAVHTGTEPRAVSGGKALRNLENTLKND